MHFLIKLSSLACVLITGIHGMQQPTTALDVQERMNTLLGTLLCQNVEVIDDIKQLIACGVDINTRFIQKDTPDLRQPKMTCLHIALRWGYEEFAQWLIEHGADVTLADRWGFTALHEAAKLDNPALIELILNKGGKEHINDFSKEGYTPLGLARLRCCDEAVKVLRAHGANK